MMKKRYNEKEDEWRIKVQDWKVITVTSLLMGIILSYYVMEYNLINTPLFWVALFFWVATPIAFCRLLSIGSDGTLKGYSAEDQEEDC